MTTNNVNVEVWLPPKGRAEGYPYEVSDWGRVRRAKPGRGTWKGRVLKQYTDKYGYPYVRLYPGKFVDSERVHFPVHSLVADTFLGPAPGPIGNGWGEWQVNHKDGNKENSFVGNLEWSTQCGNHEHACINNLTTNTHYSREEVRRMWRMYYDDGLTMQEVADKLDVPKPTVKDIIRGLSRRDDTKDLGEASPRVNAGENHGNAILTEKEVVEMRELFATGDYGQKELAEKLGLEPGLVGKVVRGETWKDVGGPIHTKTEVVTDEDRREMYALYQTGEYTYASLGEFLGLGKNTIWRHMNKEKKRRAGEVNG